MGPRISKTGYKIFLGGLVKKYAGHMPRHMVMPRAAKMSDSYIYKTQFLSLDKTNIIYFHHLPLRRPESPAHGWGVIRIFTKPNLVKKNANFFKNDAILTRFFANNTLSLLYQL